MLRENVGMQKYPGKRKVLSLGGLLMVILLCMSGFLCFFTNYIDKILYDERLGQMSEVTKQLFAGLNEPAFRKIHCRQLHLGLLMIFMTLWKSRKSLVRCRQKILV